MPAISQSRFHSTIKDPAAEALDALGAHEREILGLWTGAVRDLGISLADFGGTLDFAALADSLRRSTFASYRHAIEEVSLRLSRRGIGANRALAALNRFFEICLPFLGRARTNRATMILALTRLHAALETLLVSAYVEQPASGPTLMEASISEAEHRAHGASAYVTKIYERERRRLSHDLHDEIGHDLIMIKLYLEMIALDLKRPNPPEIEPRLNEAIGLVAHSIDAVRRLVLDLGPAVFDELGFLPAVKSYAAQFSARTKVNVTVQEGYLPENVPQTHQVALYRVLQGALSNVLKHSQAKNVLIMVVEDDGVGFDPGIRPGRRSFGLTAMRERVEVLGGTIQVQSRRADHSKKHGTRIEVVLPLPGRQEKSA
jgi:signal transduction histidine kinase